MKKWTILILLAVVVLAIVPLLMIQDSEFGGADGEAETAITEVQPDYEPWFSSIWEPPGGETESLLFALQAAIGAGVLFYALGYYVGRAKGRDQAAAGKTARGPGVPPEAQTSTGSSAGA